jgi:hypothetical protein
MGLRARDVLESPFFVVGELGDIKEHLLDIQRRYGISYITVSDDLAWQIAPLLRELGSS